MAVEDPRETLFRSLSESVDEEDGLRIFRMRTTTKIQDDTHNIQILTIGKENSGETKSVLLLGETGSGKTHFINAFVNHVFGVRLEDGFRLMLKDHIGSEVKHKTESQTDFVTGYFIYHQQGMLYDGINFMLIDTPGFGDTGGKFKQNIVSKTLNAFLVGDFGIDGLNCIGLVVKASQNRILRQQEDILNDVRSLLGNGCGDITRLLCTHAADDAPVVDVVKKMDMEFSGDHKFDNYPLFQSNTLEDTSKFQNLKYRWEKMDSAHVDFFKYLNQSATVDVRRIRELCKKTEEFELFKTQLCDKAEGMSAVLRELERRKQETQNMEVKSLCIQWKQTVVKELRYSKKVESGHHVHNCKRCDKTCKTCEDPSNVTNALVSAGSGAGVAVGTGLGTSLVSGATIGSSVGAFGGPVGVLIGAAVGTVAGLAAGLGIGLSQRVSRDDCPYASSKECCHTLGYGHNYSTDHVVSDEEIIWKKTNDELIDQGKKSQFDSIERDIRKEQSLVKQNKADLNQLTKEGQGILSKMRSLAEEIAKLSFKPDTESMEQVLNYLENRKRSSFYHDALQILLGREHMNS